jgi:spore maturation protein CgeB
VRCALFYHSLQSDWNHGNAHFLRGYASELIARGHDVRIYEPRNNWSLANLLEDQGPAGLRPFLSAYPHLSGRFYTTGRIDLDTELRGVDLVIAHEWNDPDLIARLGQYRASHPDLRLLFHDTHHRAISQPKEMARFDLSGFDGVLAFGEALRRIYVERGWGRRVWTWHEAADTRVFHPMPGVKPDADLLWIGNWGDDERSKELHEFLIGPVQELGLRATVHGVRYPASALEALARAGIQFGGYLSNAAAAPVFALHRLAVHIPRRHYTQTLPGIPTIRVFESLACGTPLLCAPWSDAEGLFSRGDYVMVETGAEMIRTLRRLLDDPAARAAQSQRGLATILARHTCAHRVEELLGICRTLGLDTAAPTSVAHATAEEPVA